MKREEKVLEKKRIIGIEPVIDIKNFTVLMLAMLAEKDNENKNKNIKTAYLNMDYKEIIEHILYRTELDFADIIDVSYYFEFQLEWEKELNEILQKIMLHQKGFRIDLVNNCFEIDFNKKSIDKIKRNCDEEVLESMNKFVELLDNEVLTREYSLKQKELLREYRSL